MLCETAVIQQWRMCVCLCVIMHDLTIWSRSPLPLLRARSHFTLPDCCNPVFLSLVSLQSAVFHCQLSKTLLTGCIERKLNLFFFFCYLHPLYSFTLNSPFKWMYCKYLTKAPRLAGCSRCSGASQRLQSQQKEFSRQ